MSGKEIEAGVALPHTMPQPLCRSAGDCVSVKVRIADPVHVDGLSGLLQDPLHPHDETSVPNGMGEENVEAICQGAQRGVESERERQHMSGLVLCYASASAGLSFS